MCHRLILKTEKVGRRRRRVGFVLIKIVDLTPVLIFVYNRIKIFEMVLESPEARFWLNEEDVWLRNQGTSESPYKVNEEYLVFKQKKKYKELRGM